MPAVALAFDAVSFSYDGPAVLHTLGMHFRSGEITAVLGPNGAGKTTLLRLAAGSLRPTQGTIRLHGANVRSLSPKQRARVVAVVPQESRPFSEFTVREVVLMGRSPHLGLLGLDGPRDRVVAEEAMVLTGVRDKAERTFRSLSGGEKQRAVIARALAQEPKVLLLDEPTAFLDLHHQLAVYDLLAGLVRDTGRTLVVASHDLNLAARYCDRMVLLHAGRVRADGPPEEVLTQALLREVYSVEADVGRDGATGRPFVVPRHPIHGPAPGPPAIRARAEGSEPA